LKGVIKWEIEFSLVYVKTLNIFFIDLYLIDVDGEVVDHIEMTAYPRVDDDNQLDISFDYAGYYFSASNLIDGSNSEMVSAASSQFFFDLMDDGGTGGGGGTLYPLINVTYSIVGIDNAENASEAIMEPVTLLNDGPTKYIYHIAKLAMIRSNYEHNSSLTEPSGMIDDQNDFSSWEYGLSDIGYAGCEIVAMYNFLSNTAGTGYDPDLASLIALTQLIYADMGLGYLGSGPTDGNLLGLVENEILDFTEYLFDEYITNELIRDVAEAIVDFYYSIPGWMQNFFDFVVTQTIDALISTLNPLLGLADSLIEIFMGQGNHFSIVLDLYQVDNSDIYYDLDDYEENLDETRHFIISFWNNEDTSGGIPDVSGMLHTIYINRDYDSSGFTGYNNSGASNRDDLYDFIDVDHSDADDMFISGVIIKK
jgi:hypothetical protein